MARGTFQRKNTNFEQNKTLTLFDFRNLWKDVDLELANLAADPESAFYAAIAGAVAGADNANPYRGFWAADVIYFANDTVVYQNSLWVALFPEIGEPPSQGDWSKMLEIPNVDTLKEITYRGDWSAATAYAQNNTVREGRAVYKALKATTNELPSATPGSWVKFMDFYTDLTTFRGIWASVAVYAKNDTAVSNGSLWRAVTPVTGTAPVEGAWTKVLDLPPGASGRETVAVTTASLGAGIEATGTIALATGYRLVKVQTNVPARVRLYGSVAQATADKSRALGTDPYGDHGLMLEYVTTSDALSATLSPTVDGYSTEAAPTKNIPYALQNMSGVSSALTLTLTWQRTE